MADSDGDYVQEISDDDIEAHRVTRRGGAGGRASGPKARGGGWEVTRTWENVVESADGTINSTIEELLEAGKRKRLLKDTTPLQRGIMRHLIILIDLSTAMAEKDLRPTRYALTLRYVGEFVTEFFEQNPISQFGIVGMRDGIAVRVSDMSGNPSEHLSNLQALHTQEPKGSPSLQNALEMARASLFHAPAHGTREILIITGALLSSDPGDIHSTITALTEARITCSVIGLAAQVSIFVTLVSRTNPSLPPSKTYSVALSEAHYRELLMRATTPPAILPSDDDPTKSQPSIRPTLLMMGFPSRIVEHEPSFCACHSKPTCGGYLCTRCSSKVCSLPTTCPVCKLTLILSTHLARSYHHLFPLQNWTEVSWERSSLSDQRECFGCLTPFPTKRSARPLPGAAPLHANQTDSNDNKDRKKFSKGGSGSGLGSGSVPSSSEAGAAAGGGSVRAGGTGGTGGQQATGVTDRVSESGRYECLTCHFFFCVDCDVFSHEIVHNCPGCLSGQSVEEVGGGALRD